MNIIGKRTVLLSVSGALVVASIAAIALFGFREGIDFLGGTLWTFRADGSVSVEQVSTVFTKDLGIADARVNRDVTTGSFLVRFGQVSEADHQRHRAALAGESGITGFEELSFQSIGPSVGAELRTRSYTAIVLVLIGISLYIAFAFRKVYRPVSSWKYGWVTLATLFHDVAIPAGMLAALGHFRGVEIDGNFVVALLVVMGFSVHDTIVVFDRIRENLLLDRGRSDFGRVVNDSVNQTMARSINTSLTLIIVLIALLVFGPANLHYFVLTLVVGVTMGIYSSIFVASPLLHLWQEMGARTHLKNRPPAI